MQVLVMGVQISLLRALGLLIDMAIIRFRVAFLLALILLGGCSSIQSWKSEREYKHRYQKALSNIDQEECKARGGNVFPVGILQMPACVIRNEDAGKECSDHSQCIGLCLIQDKYVEINTKAYGTCQHDNMPFGCSAEVKAGVVDSYTICVD